MAAHYEDPNLLANQVIRAAQDVGIRIVVLQAAYERAGWRKPGDPLQNRFTFRNVDTFLEDTDELLREAEAPIGIAPHSVRALTLDSLLAITKFARLNRLPVHMHVAEQPAEIEACVAEHGRRPVELLDEHGILGEEFTAVHAIHITQREVGYLGSTHCTVCACPTTERNLGDGTVPADVLLEAGAYICFGTDSNVQIDLLEDARCLEYHLRMKKLSRAILPAAELYRGATEAGSRALGVVPDQRDYFTVDLKDPSLAGCEGSSLATQLIFSAQRAAIRDVFVGGVQVIANGRHSKQSEIVGAFEKMQKRLFG